VERVASLQAGKRFAPGVVAWKGHTSRQRLKRFGNYDRNPSTVACPRRRHQGVMLKQSVHLRLVRAIVLLSIAYLAESCSQLIRCGSSGVSKNETLLLDAIKQARLDEAGRFRRGVSAERLYLKPNCCEIITRTTKLRIQDLIPDADRARVLIYITFVDIKGRSKSEQMLLYDKCGTLIDNRHV